jgi:hypothetical protein
LMDTASAHAGVASSPVVAIVIAEAADVGKQ